MLRRITIMLDDDLVKRIREKQAKEIKKSQKSVSFSGIINQSLRDFYKLKKWGIYLIQKNFGSKGFRTYIGPFFGFKCKEKNGVNFQLHYA